ncbi:MAG: 50S ribosomal protein L24 [Bacteroidota bacterium]|nr:50S ribosomal protein L24 [Bacteroidota bacterium]
MPKLHVKKGDTVMVLSGDDKGKTGTISTMMPAERKAIVQGVNIVTKHKKVSAQNPDGGRIQEEAPLYISKLMVVEPKSGIPSRISRVEKDGKMVRITKKSGEELK